jgi:hypothetical protein
MKSTVDSGTADKNASKIVRTRVGGKQCVNKVGLLVINVIGTNFFLFAILLSGRMDLFCLILEMKTFYIRRSNESRERKKVETLETSK